MLLPIVLFMVFTTQTVYTISCDSSLLLPPLINDEDVKQSVTNKFKDNIKLCRYRGNAQLYPPNVWKWITGYGCYSYTPTTRLNFIYPIYVCSVTVEGVSYTIPYSLHNNKTSFAFDYTNIEYSAYIKESFASEAFFEMWLDCAEEADECCALHMTTENIYPTEENPCPAIWDGWTCFPPSPAGNTPTMPCSSQAYSSTAKVCTLYSEKECFENGTWNQNTNYQPCAIAPIYRKRHQFHVIVLYVSLALSLPAVMIFCALPKLRILRVILHRNLLIAIIVRNVLSIIAKTAVILDELKPSGDSNNVMQVNSVECRVLAFFESVAKNAIFATMLVDCYYLHKLIVRIFAKDPKTTVVYLIVAALSISPTLIWAVFKSLYNNEYCWMVEEYGYQWIVDGFRIAVLAINTVLLFDIIRVLLMKLKQRTTASHAKSTLRATLFLVPLFGLHIILVSNRNIAGDTCFEEDIFYYVSYTMEGLQGVMVAFCFCYVNTEVQRELSNAYRKFRLHLEVKFNLVDSGRDVRRRTDATYVRSSVFVPRDDLPENVENQAENKSKVTEWLATNQQ